MIKVVLDTNVYMSALAFGGKPLEILIRAETGIFNLVCSLAILAELKDKLIFKFLWQESRVSAAMERIFRISKIVSPEFKLMVSSDATDNKILECAVAGNANFIISGDKKHLLSLKEYQGIKIVSPAGFFDNELWK